MCTSLRDCDLITSLSHSHKQWSCFMKACGLRSTHQTRRQQSLKIPQQEIAAPHKTTSERNPFLSFREYCSFWFLIATRKERRERDQHSKMISLIKFTAQPAAGFLLSPPDQLPIIISFEPLEAGQREMWCGEENWVPGWIWHWRHDGGV